MADDNPEAEQTIFEDMTSLEKVLKDDQSGDRARAMINYFNLIVEATRRVQARSGDDSQRHMVGQMLGGFQAADRIIRRVWETIHGMALAA